MEQGVAVDAGAAVGVRRRCLLRAQLRQSLAQRAAHAGHLPGRRQQRIVVRRRRCCAAVLAVSRLLA